MSKSIIIQTDGVAATYSNVKRLHTSNAQGDNAYWIPYEEAAQGVKTVNKNGTYKASSDGYYGYSKVIVNTNGNTVGVKSDGKKYKVTVDNSGYIVYVEMPYKIKVDTEPTKMSYTLGEPIDLTGAVVKAYVKDGGTWNAVGYSGGVIPLDEITVEPVVASESGTQVIALHWTCPDDDEEFTAMINITVGASE